LLGVIPQIFRISPGLSAEDMPAMLKLNRHLIEQGGCALSSSEYLGIAAGLLTTFAIVPQIIRVYKLKSAREISFLYNTAMLLGVIVWLVYGIVLGLFPLIIWNSIGIFLNGWLLFTKVKYGRDKTTV
jgi:MtN3 and saliva related transmembrane protein